MSILQKTSRVIEREEISVNEVRLGLLRVIQILTEREKDCFLTSKVKDLLVLSGRNSVFI